MDKQQQQLHPNNEPSRRAHSTCRQTDGRPWRPRMWMSLAAAATAVPLPLTVPSTGWRWVGRRGRSCKRTSKCYGGKSSRPWSASRRPCLWYCRLPVRCLHRAHSRLRASRTHVFARRPCSEPGPPHLPDQRRVDVDTERLGHEREGPTQARTPGTALTGALLCAARCPRTGPCNAP